MVKSDVGSEKGHVQAPWLTVTGSFLWFSKMIMLPAVPCQLLLQTILVPFVSVLISVLSLVGFNKMLQLMALTLAHDLLIPGIIH